MFLRVGMFFYMLAAVALYAIYPAWLGSLAISLPDWACWLGVAIGILSLGLLIWVHAVLGRHWNTNLRLQEGHRLVTTGPYRRVRHPMYSALIGVFSGLALIAANWLMVPLLLGSAYALVRRVGKEEAMMIAVFGDEYRDYMRRSGRFLPPLK